MNKTDLFFAIVAILMVAGWVTVMACLNKIQYDKYTDLYNECMGQPHKTPYQCKIEAQVIYRR